MKQCHDQHDNDGDSLLDTLVGPELAVVVPALALFLRGRRA
jgi:hypothetical protein